MKNKIFILFAMIMIARLIGMILLPLLIQFSPTLLIFVSPFLHHLVLSSSLIPFYIFIPLGIFVSIFQCTIGYEFGKYWGTSGIDWTCKNGFTSEEKIKEILRWLRISAPLVLFVIPGPLVAMVAGVSGLKPKYFFLPMIPSQIMWIIACYFLGVELEVYINQVDAFIFKHSLGIGIITFLILAFRFYFRRQKQ